MLRGMLVVNKPANISSKDVSRWLIKRLGKLQIGHVGTLDPFAEGVLPILLGKATRLQDYLLHTTKIYEFDLQFGEETNTLDRDGQIIRKMEYDHLTNEMLENFCKTTLGPWEQRTPIYSAVKYKGRALYQYARSGRAEEIPEDTLRRTVFIHGLELLKFDIEAGIGVFKVCCSAGTYIRALAADIAGRANTCGHVSRLVRLETAGISLDQAHSLEAIEQGIDCLSDLIVPMEKMKLDLPRFKLKEPECQRLLAGQSVCLTSHTGDIEHTENLSQTAIVLDTDNRLYALAEVLKQTNGDLILHMKRALA